MKGINPHDEVKGSNPSPGAYYESISGYPMENVIAIILQ
jgi:hypothetical protein